MTLHDRWRTEMLSRPRRRASVIFDLDTTVLTVYGRQEKSAVGFNPKKRGRRSYPPLLCFEGESADVFAGSYPPGDVQPGPVTGPLLESVFRKLPGAIRQARVRADAAFYNHEIAEIIEEKGAFYVIVARLTHRLKNRREGLRDRRISSGGSAAEFRYCPDGWKRPARFVVIRRPVPEEPSAQRTLFQMRGPTYQAFVTHLTLFPLNLWRFYNQRATAERIIRELKDACALGQIPTRDFAAHEVFFQIVLLAYNLLNGFKRLCAPPCGQRSTLQRLRPRLLVVPAQRVHPAGAPTLRIAPGYVYAEDFLDILKRMKDLAPLSAAEATSHARRTASKANKRTLRKK